MAAACFTGCVKGPAAKTTCTSTIYGYTMPGPTYFDSIAVCNQGAINPASATFTPSGSGTFLSSGFENQVAYNTSNHCYYAFKTRQHDEGNPPLYEVNSSGTVTALGGAMADYDNLVYNDVTNKLYCSKNGAFCEVAISSGSFSATATAATVHPLSGYNSGSTAVDRNSGTMYAVTGTLGACYIERITSGSTSSAVIVSTPSQIFGLRFNKADNMLYGITLTPATPIPVAGLVKIDPSTGTITTLTSIPLQNINLEILSTCMDHCTNHYMVSTLNGGQFVLDQYSTTGILLQHNLTSTFFQGLEVD